MQSSLLLWDQLHTIVPDPNYAFHYDSETDMAAAWELIGARLCPSDLQRAHTAIERTLESGVPTDLQYVAQVDRPADPYEVWPQKFSAETWSLLQAYRMTALPLPNGDYPFTEEGGLLVMAKLADACAGETFARVTDRLMAYGLIGSGETGAPSEGEVVHITLDLIDASSIPLKDLIAFRQREQRERRGHDFTRMRHTYADSVQAHISKLATVADEFERNELNRQFRARMDADLKTLQDELGANSVGLVLKPVVVAAVATAGALMTGIAGLPTALAIGAAAALGSNVTDVAKAVADFVKEGFKFDQDQRKVMVDHPMAYMYALSSTRGG
jgi:hypothetical protein